MFFYIGHVALGVNSNAQTSSATTIALVFDDVFIWPSSSDLSMSLMIGYTCGNILIQARGGDHYQARANTRGK